MLAHWRTTACHRSDHFHRRSGVGSERREQRPGPVPSLLIAASGGYPLGVHGVPNPITAPFLRLWLQINLIPPANLVLFLCGQSFECLYGARHNILNMPFLDNSKQHL